MHRWIPLVVALCLAGSAAPAAAQFTAAVVPPKKTSVRPTTPSPITAAPESTTTAPSPAAQKTLSSMKAWVDSAATALAQQPAAPPESTTTVAAQPAPSTPAPSKAQKPATPRKKPAPAPAQQNVSKGEVGNFHNGARAPATATPLPMLAVLGVASLIAGALLRRRWS